MESRQHNESKILEMVVLDQHVARRRSIERTKLCSVCGAPVTRKRHTIPVLCAAHRAIAQAQRDLENIEESVLTAEPADVPTLVVDDPPPAPMTSAEVYAFMQQRLDQRVEQRVDRKPSHSFQEAPATEFVISPRATHDVSLLSERETKLDLDRQEAHNERERKMEEARHARLASVPRKTGALPYPAWTGDKEIDFLLMQRTDALNEYEDFQDIEYDAFREQRRLLESICGLNEQLAKKGWPFDE